MWLFRNLRPSDESFVYSSWLRSYRDSPAMAGVPNTVYYAEVHDCIENVLKRATVLVAANEADSDQILGYVVYEPGVLYFTYVKHPFRGNGIGKALENAALVNQTAPVKYTCMTRAANALAKKRAYLQYDPFRFFNAKR